MLMQDTAHALDSTPYQSISIEQTSFCEALKYFGHINKRQNGMEKTILEGIMAGKRQAKAKRGDPVINLLISLLALK